MALSPQQIALVQATFPTLSLAADRAAEMFYGRLFELDSSVKPLFRTDMREQGHKLMQMIAAAVASLDRLGEIVPAIQDLGRRHVAYGVKREHYQVVREALLWTLEAILKDELTPEVKEAWTQTYDLLAQTAVAAAYG